MTKGKSEEPLIPLSGEIISVVILILLMVVCF